MNARIWSLTTLGLLLATTFATVHSAQTDLSDVPLVTSSSNEVHSNLMFILDDSGSMNYDYLPDWAGSGSPAVFQSRNAAWNGVAYNPAIRYSPPVYFNADGTLNTTAYPSMNGMTTATGADSTAKPNWKAVKQDGYGVQWTGTSNLQGNAYFYTTIPGEYCSSPNLRDCISASSPTTTYRYPASLRWCSSAALTTCKATWQSDYANPRYPVPFQATITVGGGTTTTKISSIKIDGVEILNATTGGASTANTIATQIRDGINSCSFGLSGNCGVAGYTATANNNVVTVSGVSTTTSTPVITVASGNFPVTPTAFARQAVPGSSPSFTLANGANLRTVIHSGLNSYPFPGSTTKSPGRTDCAGATCTYDEEMTNYANWYAYYRTRMQLMKTAASIAFSTFGEVYDASATPPGLVTKKPLRVGYYTISANGINATGTNFLNIGEFSFPHKKNWYDKLFSGDPTSWTPLRGALSKAGQYFANKLSGQVDPVQYSCQRNVALLSTDGYWNTDDETSSYGPKQLDNSTNVGNQDGSEVRPYNDGAAVTVTETTPTTTVVRQQTVSTVSTATVQQRTRQYYGGYGANGCSSTRHRLFTETQQQSRTVVVTTTRVDDVTTISTRTLITVNGTLMSDTTSSNTSTTNVSSSPVTDSDSGWSAWTVTGTSQSNCTTSTFVQNPNPSASSVVSNNATTTAGPTVTVLSTVGPTVGTTTSTSSSSGGISNSLADVAEYYYKTDLRSTALGNCVGSLGAGSDVCADNVKPVRSDGASWQHLTTYTLGLGVNGLMQYQPGYQSATSGDFYDLGTSSRAAAVSSDALAVCPWMSDGASCTWPSPAANAQTAVDDLWHAAVNGRGLYFSASDAGALATSLADSLASIEEDTGSSSAATTSNPNVTSGDNFVFESTFTESSWDGQLIRRRMNLFSGEVMPGIDWSARELLDTNTSRNIYTFSNTASNKLREFTWANLTTTEQAYFSLARLSATGGLTQFCASGSVCLSAANQSAAAGAPLVAFLRGDRSNEGVLTDTTKYFRLRDHLLGDIVNAEAVYVKAPLNNYEDKGYSAFKASQATRTSVVYAPANDGMVHAFSATTGAELWSYIPSFVMPSLYQLADKNYKNQHKFMLDGTPVVGDICVSNCSSDAAVWKTIMVGGQNRGGRGYYALDITNPSAPAALWEFTDDNLGYTYGNPIVTKLKNGTWVVIFASGYNNVSPGDGVGRIFVVNAFTGQLVTAVGGDGTISTGAGSPSTPSGLARLSAWADSPGTDNTALRVYGGDLLGNLWRFDINGDVGTAGYDAQLLATFKDADDKVQPVTEAPQLGDINGMAVVLVGTGKYLGVSDATISTQSFYAVKDELTATGVGTPRTNARYVSQTITKTTCPQNNNYCQLGQVIYTGSTNAVDWSSNDGWFFDFPQTNERSHTDPQLVQGTLVFTTNIPELSACTSGGTSYQYYVDYRTGAPVEGASPMIGINLGNALATRPVFVQLPNGKIVVLTRLSSGKTPTSKAPIGSMAGPTRRMSWRELSIDQ